jgi:hypothetical protein
MCALMAVQLLQKMNNFHTLMALVAGLNNASLQRLNKTRSAVPPKLLQVPPRSHLHHKRLL